MAGLAVRRAISASVKRLLDNESGAIAGRGVEPLHKARVAVRRLRSDLRTFRELVDARWSGKLRQELRWLGSELGAVRDYDVFLSRIRAAAARSGAAGDPNVAALIAAARDARSASRARMVEALRSARYARLRARLELAARSPRLTLAARLTASQALPPIMKRRKKRIRNAVEGLPTRPTFASLHRIRILAKRLRYAAEAVAFVAGSQTTTVAKAAERLQDVLGELNDAVCACRLLRRLRTRRDLALAANALLALEIEAVSRARAGWAPAWQGLAAAEMPAWR
ncbi:MAG: CHAD domain-containing protein [Candidatus Eremiobacterales bacterium]|jgi:CHAD domain-containing protein